MRKYWFLRKNKTYIVITFFGADVHRFRARRMPLVSSLRPRIKHLRYRRMNLMSTQFITASRSSLQSIPVARTAMPALKVNLTWGTFHRKCRQLMCSLYDAESLISIYYRWFPPFAVSAFKLAPFAYTDPVLYEGITEDAAFVDNIVTYMSTGINSLRSIDFRVGFNSIRSMNSR